MQNQQIFVSGIDTDCGKTYITGLLAYHLRKSGVNCITSKLVQTGCQGISEDILAHRKIMEIDLLPEDIDTTTCPYVYPFPASPHLSASLTSKKFDINLVHNKFKSLQERYEMVITEGAGGLMVPLTYELLSTDYIRNNQIPVILVSSSKLGSINHTLLSIEYCRMKEINLRTIIYNEFPQDDPQIAASTFQYFKKYLLDHHPNIQFMHGHGLNKTETVTFKDLNLL